MTQDQNAKSVRSSSVGWMLQRITKQLTIKMEARLTEVDLSVLQFSLQMTVLEHPGLTQTEIGTKITAPSYAISRAIDSLVTKGLLERRDHPSSRRAHTIHPTKSGTDLGPTLFAIVKEMNAALLADFTPKEQATFQALLSRLL